MARHLGVSHPATCYVPVHYEEGVRLGAAVAAAVAARHYAMHHHPGEYAAFEKKFNDTFLPR
jgi:hypothetical protein